MSAGRLAAALLTVACTLGGPKSADGRTRADVEAAVTRSADALLKAVRLKDVRSIMSFVPKQGFPCGDGSVTRAEFEKSLRQRGTWMNAYFFDSATFNSRFRDGAYPMSLDEFLRASAPMRSSVSFVEYDPERPFGYPVVQFYKNGIEYVPGFEFTWGNGRWLMARIPTCE